MPFLERLERPAVALDLPGLGRLGAALDRELDHSMHGLARFVERFRDALGIGEYDLVGPRLGRRSA